MSLVSRIDALPADQKAVLQLLLRQGKGYDDLSTLLRLEPDAVRSRAYDALDALGPGAGGLSAERRHGLADWLLGQQDPDTAKQTLAFLETSSGGRAWARSVAGELEPLGGDRLPSVPADRAASNGAPAPAVTAPAVPDAAADDPAAVPFAPAAPAVPRVSRTGGAMLLAGALAVVVIGVIGYLLLSGGSDKDSKASTPTTSTAAQPKAQVQAQANLLPPSGAPNKKAAGIAQIVLVGTQQAVNAVAQGLPVIKNAAWAIWLYGGTNKYKLVGGFDKTDNKGHLIFQGALPGDLSPYNEMLVTRETSGNPTRPGQIYLRGAIGAPQSSSGSG
jgi:hypothetical protein